MRLNRLFVTALLIIAAAVFVGCVSNQIGDNARDGSIIGPGPLPSPSPTPTPVPSPSPSPSASPSGGQIASVRVGPFGQDMPVGIAPPPNNQRPYPVGFHGATYVTATPKDAAGNDVPLSVHGTNLEWSVPVGADVVDVFIDPVNPHGFNVKVYAESPGLATLRATLRPPDGSAPIVGQLDLVVG